MSIEILENSYPYTISIADKFRFKKTLCFLFSGHAGVGKTYCAKLLINLLKENRISCGYFPFAYGVKETANFMGWDGEKHQRGRRLLQRIGQFGREYDPYMWVRSTMTRAEESIGYPYDAIVIDDWRFINEVEYIRSNEPLYKPITIRLGAPHREILKGTPEYNEISETELDEYYFDYKFYNTQDGPEYATEFLEWMIKREIENNT